MQDCLQYTPDWWTVLAERTQRCADMGDMRAFYEAPRTVYGPSHQVQAPLHPADGHGSYPPALLEHFEGLFGDHYTVQ